VPAAAAAAPVPVTGGDRVGGGQTLLLDSVRNAAGTASAARSHLRIHHELIEEVPLHRILLDPFPARHILCRGIRHIATLFN
jgi:hypothetical protein